MAEELSCQLLFRLNRTFFPTELCSHLVRSTRDAEVSVSDIFLFDEIEESNVTNISNVPSKKLAIASTRTCDCPPNHINCMTPKEWIKCQLGVWQFAYEGRDIRDKVKHPATFPI